MNKNRLMASGALLAIGAMFPIATGALMGAKTPPMESAVVATASPSATAPDCANLKPGEAWAGVSLHCGLDTPAATPPAPTATATAPAPTYSGVAVGPSTVPAPAQTEPAPIQEDDPAWNCFHDGNKLCGVEPSKLADAWASFDGVAVAGAVGKSIAFRATYVGMSGASSLPGYWVVASLQYPDTFHVFLIEPGE